VRASEAAKKKPAKKSPDKAPKIRAEDRYADAFAKGQASQGFPITPLASSDKKLLGTIAAAHARYRDGSPITGEALVQWFYQRARDFRGDKPDTSFVRGGASPIGFRTWLDNGGDGKPRPLAPGQQDPDDDEPDFMPEEEDIGPPLPPERAAAVLESFGLHEGARVIRENAGKKAANG